MYNSIIEKIKDKNICILGFGREGRSTYNFIRRHLSNKFLNIIDKNDVFENFNDSNANLIYGEDYLNNLDEYDLIIKTPGISLNDINITNIKEKITSQMSLILDVFNSQIIGITGTKGKSTTSSLMYKILKDQGYDVYLLGNIGNPIFDDIENFNEKTYLVIEMSAHQLEYINLSPHIGMVLNLYEDHLDHAKTVEHYHENKMNMFKYQKAGDFAIYSKDDVNTINQINKNNYLSSLYSVTLKNDKSLNNIYLDNNDIILNNEVLYNKNNERNLLGDHNLSNIMFCLTASKLLNLNMDKVCESIKKFIPLEHRLEKVGTFNGVTYYNDSISTIPMATINAIEALKNVNTLIFGGMDRGIDYLPLVEYLKKCNVENLICMPTTGYKIGKLIENKNIYYIETLKEAVSLAKKITKKNTICLMSPAASSYEYFKNFEEKGTEFKRLVKEDN